MPTQAIRALLLLEDALKHSDAAVRLFAFDSLKQTAATFNTEHAGISSDIQYLILALNSGFADVGLAALDTIATLPRPLSVPLINVLQRTLKQHDIVNVRHMALHLLEQLTHAGDAQPDLLALHVQPDVKQATQTIRAGLIRLYQRKLLDQLEVQRQLIHLQESSDLVIRQTAFWVAVSSQPALAKVLMNQEAEFTRGLKDLEQFNVLEDSDKTHAPVPSPKPSKPERPTQAVQATTLNIEPLLHSLTSPYADISFLAAYGLALLHNAEAIGILLRLANDKDSEIRRGVAKALGILQLPNSQSMLVTLLHDSNALVRDTAFSAYEKLAENPLDWALQGLKVHAADIQQRALSIVLEQLKTVNPDNLQRVQNVLAAALNSPFETIRSEVAKVALHRHLDGSVAATWHLLLNTPQIDVHLAVFEAFKACDDAYLRAEFLPLLLNDPYEKVANSVFTYALGEKKIFERMQVLTLALQSQNVAMRQAAYKNVTEAPNQQVNDLLVHLFNDVSSELRVKALKSALGLTKNQAALLEQALISPYIDIRLAAAEAAAAFNDPKAFDIVQDILSRPQPSDGLDNLKNLEATSASVHSAPLDETQWRAAVNQCFKILEILGDVRGFAWARHYLALPNEDFTASIGQALPTISRLEHADILEQWLKHASLDIQQGAALSLAVLGDARAWSLLRQDSIQAALASRYLLALNGLNQVDAQALEAAFNQDTIRNQACFLLAAHELIKNPAQPVLSIQALSSQNATTVLFFAGLVSRYPDIAACWQWIADWLNHRPVQRSADNTFKAWAIDTATVRQLAEQLVRGAPPVQFKAGQLLPLLTLNNMNAFEFKWLLFKRTLVTDLPVNAPLPTLPNPATTAPHESLTWRQMALGTYVGLIRTDNTPLEQREQAVHQLVSLANANPALKTHVCACLSSLLNLAHQTIRQKAYAALQSLDVPAAQLGQLALHSPYADIIKLGLNTWIATLAPADAEMQLVQLLNSSSDVLSHAALPLLQTSLGVVGAARQALQSYTESLRLEAIKSLEPLAQDSRNPEREQALSVLADATHNDHVRTALTALNILMGQRYTDVERLARHMLYNTTNQTLQEQILTALPKINSPSVAQWVLNYKDHPQRRAGFTLWYTLGTLRQPIVADGLLNQLARNQADKNSLETNGLLKSILEISGYDQPIIDFDGTSPDKTWLSQQQPRHTDVLVKLFNQLLKMQWHDEAAKLIRALTWCPDPQADTALLGGLVKINTSYVPAVVSAMAWRAKHRHGNVQGLKQALRHKNPDVQFLAAEGLAQCGLNDGTSILMAAIDYNPSGDYRKRAVLALGELGEPRLFDRLLKLAQHEGHFLQIAASEALGHIGKGRQGEKVLRLIKQQLDKPFTYLVDFKHLLNGLRWLNTSQSWTLLREATKNVEQDSGKIAGLELLRHHDSPENREFLLSTIKTSTSATVVRMAYESAQWLWQQGNIDALTVSEPDLVMLQTRFVAQDSMLLKRITAYSTAPQLFDIYGKICRIAVHSSHAAYQTIGQQLAAALLNRRPWPMDMLSNSLNSPFWALVEIGAHYLSLQAAPEHSASNQAIQPVLLACFERTLAALDEQFNLRDLPRYQHDKAFKVQTVAILTAMRHLIRAVLVQQVQAPIVIASFVKWLNHVQPIYAPLQAELLQALLSKPQAALLPDLQDALTQYAARASGELKTWVLALLNSVTPAAKLQAPDVHRLVTLIQTQNLTELAHWATDTTLDNELRKAAIEGLGRIGTAAAMDTLTLLMEATQLQSNPLAQVVQYSVQRTRRLQAKQALLRPLPEGL